MIVVVINEQIETECFEQQKQEKEVIPDDETDEVSHDVETVLHIVLS